MIPVRTAALHPCIPRVGTSCRMEAEGAVSGHVSAESPDPSSALEQRQLQQASSVRDEHSGDYQREGGGDEEPMSATSEVAAEEISGNVAAEADFAPTQPPQRSHQSGDSGAAGAPPSKNPAAPRMSSLRMKLAGPTVASTVTSTPSGVSAVGAARAPAGGVVSASHSPLGASATAIRALGQRRRTDGDEGTSAVPPSIAPSTDRLVPGP